MAPPGSSTRTAKKTQPVKVPVAPPTPSTSGQRSATPLTVPKTGPPKRAEETPDVADQDVEQPEESDTNYASQLRYQDKQEYNQGLTDLRTRLETSKTDTVTNQMKIDKETAANLKDRAGALVKQTIAGAVNEIRNGLGNLKYDCYAPLGILKLTNDQHRAQLKASRKTSKSDKTGKKLMDACVDHETSQPADLSGEQELAKVVANPADLPRLPSGSLGDCKDKAFLKVCKNFLPVLRAQFIPPETWNNVEITNWIGKVQAPGNITCQEFLQEYLIPFLLHKGNQEAILQLSCMGDTKTKKWADVIKTINNRGHSTIVDHLTDETITGEKSHLFDYYYGILKCLYVRKSLGWGPTSEPPETMDDSDKDFDDDELHFHLSPALLLEAITKGITHELDRQRALLPSAELPKEDTVTLQTILNAPKVEAAGKGPKADTGKQYPATALKSKTETAIRKRVPKEL